MSPLIGETLGQIITVFGWDGTHFYPLDVDADGHLQVDALTAPLPAGAATAAHQVTMITALQLIDDLRAALATVATDSLRATVISSALPTGAATQATLAALLALFRGAQRGYGSGLAKEYTQLCAGAGDNSVLSGLVPAGEVWHITRLNSKDDITACTMLRYAHNTGGVPIYLNNITPAIAGVLDVLDCELWLDAGDRLRARYGGTTAGDTLTLRIFGEVLGV